MVLIGSKNDVRIPAKIIPKKTMNTRLPPAIFCSSEMENNEEAMVGATHLIPDDIVCPIPFVEPNEAFEGQFSTMRTCIDPVQCNQDINQTTEHTQSGEKAHHSR